MRHRKKTIKLGRTSAHREALLASLVCNLIQDKRIRTTLPKAKAARSLAEKMVTLGKRGTLAARRLAIARIRREDRVAMLFSTIAPAFKDRQGGYTRIIKIGPRLGDNAETALLEWVDYTPAPPRKKKAKAKDTAKEGGKDEKGKAGKAKKTPRAEKVRKKGA
ncbi:MAG: 50S ribosomal protein L17 [Kiritimatiellae bacterium]|nr:50S ribosomal protein L17 [Kiritimatiellia bacterium]